MSRIGVQPVKIEDGVDVQVNDRNVVFKGPKGELTLELPEFINVKVEDGNVIVERVNETKVAKSLHGTIRSIVKNNVIGVKDGYEKKLEIIGVGYRVKPEGNGLSLSLGWTHPVVVEAPEGITFDIPDEVSITVSGIDKQLVGETAAKIRELRKPEPYKGKGVRYEGEYVKQKSPKVVTAE